MKELSRRSFMTAACIGAVALAVPQLVIAEQDTYRVVKGFGEFYSGPEFYRDKIAWYSNRVADREANLYDGYEEFRQAARYHAMKTLGSLDGVVFDFFDPPDTDKSDPLMQYGLYSWFKYPDNWDTDGRVSHEKGGADRLRKLTRRVNHYRKNHPSGVFFGVG